MAGEVTLSHMLGRDTMPVFDSSQVAYILVQVSATAMMANVRLPLNFSIVIDRSGSMSGRKMESVKAAVKMVIDQLSPNDFVSVVVFNQQAETVIASMPAQDPQGMKAFIDTIRARGGTHMDKGMRLGLDELHRWQMPNAIKRMILLTDGHTLKKDACLQLAHDARRLNCPIFPLGLGAGWDERLLDGIGVASGGREAEFIRRPEDAMVIFQQQLTSAMAVVIRNAVLTVRFPQGVTPKRAIKVLPVISEPGPGVLADRQLVLPLGDVERDQPQSILIEVILEPRAAGLFRIAQAELSYDVPTVGMSGEKVLDDVKVTFKNDPVLNNQYHPEVMNIVEKVTAHRLVTRALDEYRETGRVTTQISPNVTRVLDPETQAALSQITRGQRVSEEEVKSISNKTRKLTQRLDQGLY